MCLELVIQFHYKLINETNYNPVKFLSTSPLWICHRGRLGNTLKAKAALMDSPHTNILFSPFLVYVYRFPGMTEGLDLRAAISYLSCWHKGPVYITYINVKRHGGSVSTIASQQEGLSFVMTLIWIYVQELQILPRPLENRCYTNIVHYIM